METTHSMPELLVKTVESLSPTSKNPCELQKQSENVTKRRMEIMRVVLEVEQSKHLSEPLTPEQRGVIANDILKQNWTIEDIKRRGEIVKKTNTYKSIGFEWWFNAEEVYCGEDIMPMVERRIKQRRETYLTVNPTANEEELAKEGLIDAQAVWMLKISEAVQKHKERYVKRIKKAEAFLRIATEEVKDEVYNILLSKGKKIDKDPFWKSIIHLFAGEALEEIEVIMRRVR
jgi:hypothetical protein